MKETIQPAMSLPDDLLGGSRRALARALTLVESGDAQAAPLLAALYPHTGRAHLVGITGAPGTGKSSLVNRLALDLRAQGRTVGIIAIDPTSPFTGGAILGDRIRMRDLSGDFGIFIRSMASRGNLGGLSRATADATKLLDAAGFDVVLIETVGAGQAEVDIARHAQTVVVVEAPGFGDDVQAIKAGILEIADILVVNKSDDPRARNTVSALRAMLDLGSSDSRQMMHHGRLVDAPPAAAETPASDAWAVPIHSTNALTGEGVPDLVAALDAHRAYLQRSGELRRREELRAAAELDRLLCDALVERLLGRVEPGRVAALVAQIAARELTARDAVARLIAAQEASF